MTRLVIANKRLCTDDRHLTHYIPIIWSENMQAFSCPYWIYYNILHPMCPVTLIWLFFPHQVLVWRYYSETICCTKPNRWDKVQLERWMYFSPYLNCYVEKINPLCVLKYRIAVHLKILITERINGVNRFILSKRKCTHSRTMDCCIMNLLIKMFW